ncbi:unnamed protein product [Effrenium voratum]|nr:unnamed protein product [Effrenium voratum]
MPPKNVRRPAAGLPPVRRPAGILRRPAAAVWEEEKNWCWFDMVGLGKLQRIWLDPCVPTEAWMSNACRVEPDENRALREEAEKLRNAGAAGAHAPDENSYEPEAGDLEADRKKRKEAKEKRGKKKKKRVVLEGKKALKDVVGPTGLDPDPEVRKILLKRASRAVRKKRKRSDDSSGRASSSSKSEEEPEELFGCSTRPEEVGRRFPGVLAAEGIREMRASLLKNTGQLWDLEDGPLPPPLSTMYFRQTLMSKMAPPMARETHTLCYGLDLLLQGLMDKGICEVVPVDELSVDPLLLTGDQEIRKDKSFPASSRLFRIYLDNFDFIQKVDSQLAFRLEGRESPEQEAVRKAYESACLPRHPKKSVVSAERAEVQGAVVRGKEGVAYPRPEKVLKYMGLAVELIVWGRAGLKHLQVVAGGLVYIAMFRRPLFCALNCVWRHIEVLKQGGGKPQLLPPAVVAELVRFLCLVPLAQLDFRGELVGDVTASDASTTGTVMWDDVRTVTEEVVLQWSTQFSSAGVVLIGAGRPCQGVSKLNADKKGALKDARSCLFAEVPRITALIRRCFPWCQVKFLMESVASMDDCDRHHMSEAIGCTGSIGSWVVAKEFQSRDRLGLLAKMSAW